MNKLVFLTGFVLLSMGMVAGTTDYQGPKDKPHITNAPGDQAPNIETPKVPGKNVTAPGKGLSGGVGKALNFLPAQASNTARNVLNTIVDTPSAQLGEALQNLLGNQGNNSTAR